MDVAPVALRGVGARGRGVLFARPATASGSTLTNMHTSSILGHTFSAVYVRTYLVRRVGGGGTSLGTTAMCTLALTM